MVAKRAKKREAAGASGRKALADIVFRLGLAGRARRRAYAAGFEPWVIAPLHPSNIPDLRAATAQHAKRVHQQPARQPGAAAQRRTGGPAKERGAQPRHVVLVPKLRESF